jgi:hypothetical protein
MIRSKALYRTRQFWQALRAAPAPEDLVRVQGFLSPKLFEVFCRMSQSEQAHSIQVFNKLVAQGESNPDLLAAALLHDVGKSRFPLAVWERVAIVLVRAFSKNLAERLGDLNKLGQRLPQVWPGAQKEQLPWQLKPFLVAEHHPSWGASAAQQAGASELTVNLIHRHQERASAPEEKGRAASERQQSEAKVFEDSLLRKLQAVDDES